MTLIVIFAALSIGASMVLDHQYEHFPAMVGLLDYVAAGVPGAIFGLLLSILFGLCLKSEEVTDEELPILPHEDGSYLSHEFRPMVRVGTHESSHLYPVSEPEIVESKDGRPRLVRTRYVRPSRLARFLGLTNAGGGKTRIYIPKR